MSHNTVGGGFHQAWVSMINDPDISVLTRVRRSGRANKGTIKLTTSDKLGNMSDAIVVEGTTFKETKTFVLNPNGTHAFVNTFIIIDQDE
jgi:hypothetical protein